MENQEIPKTANEENIEKPESKLEQASYTTGLPVEKEIPVRLSELNDEIEKKSQKITDTQGRIDELRNEFGLPVTDEVPPSIMIDKEGVAKLQEEKAGLENNSLQPVNQEPQNEAVKRFEGNLRSALDDISSKSKTMLDALYERQQQQLTPLQNSDEFQGMASHIKNLKNFEGTFDAQGLEQINETVQKIGRLIETMNPRQTGGGVRENPQNLEKLAYGAKQFSASLDEAGRNLGPELQNENMEEKRKELRKSLGFLSEQAQKLNSLAARMRGNFR